MTVAINNMTLGAGNVSLAAWVADKAAASFTDVGATFESAKLTRKEKWHSYDNVQQYPGVVDEEPIFVEEEIEFTMGETDLAKLRWAMNIAAGQLTGVAPNETLLVGFQAKQFWTLKLDTNGPRGTGGTRGAQAISAWKVRLGMDSIEYDRDKPQQVKVKGVILYDISVTTADKLHKHVISGAA